MCLLVQMIKYLIGIGDQKSIISKKPLDPLPGRGETGQLEIKAVNSLPGDYLMLCLKTTKEHLR